MEAKTEVEATSILPSLNGKTARSRRAIVPSTRLAREGRMTVIIGRRELLVALGGAVAAWPLATRAQQQGRSPRIGIIDDTPMWDAFRQGLRDLGYP